MKFYFTFGSWEKFPFQDTYLVVCAANKAEAKAAFRAKYPDVTPNTYNYSSMYSEKEWERVYTEYYTDQKPADIIWVPGCFGSAPEGYDDLYIFVPETKQIIRITEGTGDNLLDEDIEEGYVDYIIYDQYDLDCGIEEADGGQIMLTELLRETYQCIADVIPEVLDIAYGNKLLNCIILA